jgi:Beta-1,3-glucanase
MGNLTARIGAALNRGTLLANARQPDATAADFYRVPVTNHHARLVHSATVDGAGYAFPYDDVHADGYNTEGRVVDPHPARLTIEVGCRAVPDPAGASRCWVAPVGIGRSRRQHATC